MYQGALECMFSLEGEGRGLLKSEGKRYYNKAVLVKLTEDPTDTCTEITGRALSSTFVHRSMACVADARKKPSASERGARERE